MKTPIPLIDKENISYAHIDAVSAGIQSSMQDNDLQQYEDGYLTIIEFLTTHTGTTQSTYTGELERLLQWACLVQEKSLLEFVPRDIYEFLDFCQSPPDNWKVNAPQKRFMVKSGERIANPSWRPFVLKQGMNLNSKTINKVFVATSSYFLFLLRSEKITADPTHIVNMKKYKAPKLAGPKIKHLLSMEDWEMVNRALEELTNKDPKYLREKFMLTAMYNMYLRVSDLAEYKKVIPAMCDFYYKRESGWWFTAYGKGNKQGDIPANKSVMKALNEYREHLNLMLYPSAMDETPLILDRNGKKPVKTTRQLSRLIKEVFEKAYEMANDQGWPEEQKIGLQSATTHWIRHTGISEGVKYRPISHVMEDSRHENLQTTSLYIDTDDRERALTS